MAESGPPFTLEFTASREDAVAAYEALPGTTERPLRIFVIAFFGPVLVMLLRQVPMYFGAYPLMTVATLVFWGSILWRFGIKPELDRWLIRRNTLAVQLVTMTIDVAGIHLHVEGVGEHLREWSELKRLANNEVGLTLVYPDQTLNLLPARAFASSAEREAVRAFISQKLGTEPEAEWRERARVEHHE